MKLSMNIWLKLLESVLLHHFFTILHREAIGTLCIKNLELEFLVKTIGSFVLLFLVTIENNRKFKELLVSP